MGSNYDMNAQTIKVTNEEAGKFDTELAAGESTIAEREDRSAELIGKSNAHEK